MKQTISITKTDLLTSTGYCSTKTCPLARAITRTHNITNPDKIWVGELFVTINKQKWIIVNRDWDENKADELIAEAKIGGEPTIDIHLVAVEEY